MVDVRVFDSNEGNYDDINGTLRSLCDEEMAESGALLVRPDGIVGYRFSDDVVLKQPSFDVEVEAIIQRVLRFEKS